MEKLPKNCRKTEKCFDIIIMTNFIINIYMIFLLHIIFNNIVPYPLPQSSLVTERGTMCLAQKTWSGIIYNIVSSLQHVYVQ